LLRPDAVNWQAPFDSLLEHTPLDQPVKVLPAAGFGVKVTTVPVKTLSAQSAPHVMLWA
jgi:hypothetical protein